ncbi:hypothetical protein DMH04_41495 [Kibdelosporangium aridum]|uniref:Uncharacterized protein n=1 Tax=Kibdelosporangium aridum TaxID=2030 RepID=A0A428YUV6_KIBAR|nr:hypothetical protein [Kibdelosporangium aridum]RSM73488.1 hypothetical protein DMH04_41495 [Kibdelosporangium aridum]
MSGFIVISDHGCAGYTALVTTGELAGTLWDVWDVWWRPAKVVPSGPGDGEPRYLGPTPTFEDWYDAWLTDALSSLTR